MMSRLTTEDLEPRVLKRIYIDKQTPTNRWECLPRNIVDICFDLRSSVTGASDPWTLKSVRDLVNHLKTRIEQWVEFHNEDSPEHEIDKHVKGIILQTIRIGERELQRGWDYNWSKV